MAYHVDATRLSKMQINLKEKYEVKVWCYLFNCSKKQLQTAVEKVGASASAVKRFMKVEVN